MENIFYTYAYLDLSSPGKYTTSTLTFLYKPLYIGKGKNKRLYHGQIALQEGKSILTNRRLYCKLKNLLMKGFEPCVIKLQDNLTSNEALDLENVLINDLGRLKYDTDGILLNICKGGEIWDTTGVPSPSKGKKMKDFLSDQKYESYITACRKPKSKNQIQKMVETRKKNNTYHTKEKHAMAKNWKIINPNGIEFNLTGTLKDFCEQHNLSWQTLYNNKNLGPIILDRTRYKNVKRLSQKFFNTLGWQLIDIF